MPDGVHKVFALVVAAGLGTRFGGGLPKQFVAAAGDVPVHRCARLFLSLDFIAGVLCVIPAGFFDVYQKLLRGLNDKRLLPPVIGGETRATSVKVGVEALAEYKPDFVLIHDAARCFCPTEVVRRVFEKLKEGEKAVVPTVTPVDSVRLDNLSVDRSRVTLAQTPQGFDFQTILSLHRKYEGSAPSDDVSLCDRDEIEVVAVAGDFANKKITFRSDIQTGVFKTGFGYDAHRFSSDENRTLYLMGVKIEGHRGLDGVSDADVGIHSLVDAILGALGKGSIGEHFPETDPANKNVDSTSFLKYCQELLVSCNANIVNIDATIICETPKVSQHSETMKKIIAEMLCIDENVVNIKGKTTEGMGFEGQREGISASAVVTLYQVG